MLRKGFALGCVTCKILRWGALLIKYCVGVRYFKMLFCYKTLRWGALLIKFVLLNNFRVTFFEINCTLGH